MEFLSPVCKNNTPLFNETIFNSFDSKGRYSLDFDKQYLIRNLETILYKGTAVSIIEEIKVHSISFYKVSCKDYPCDKDLFVHKQNIAMAKECKRVLPNLEKVQKKLRALKNIPYFWGGTLVDPLKNPNELFKNEKLLTPFEKKCFAFEGLDCSGLIYHVTNGYTPRNTGHLMNFGQVCKTLKPLDLILWPGHVVLVLDDKYTIESREFDGLVTEPIEKRLFEIREKRVWVEKIEEKSKDKSVYTTRRFY